MGTIWREHLVGADHRSQARRDVCHHGRQLLRPSTDMSDSILALELNTGRIMWAKQTLPGDIWTSGCNSKGNCPGPDYDYGSSALLERIENGRDVLLAGQKSGVVYALDPDKKGQILWQVRVGQGGINGGESGFSVYGPDGSGEEDGGGAPFMLNTRAAVLTSTLPQSDDAPAQRLEVRPKTAK